MLDLELILYFILYSETFLSNIYCKADLRSALEHMICKKAESIIMVDELVQRINDRFPGAHGFERCNILKELSKIYGKKVEYMGEKKRYDNCYLVDKIPNTLYK